MTVSAIFTVRAGRHSGSIVLILLMTAWVIAPFVALLWALRTRFEKSLYVLTMCVAICSVAAYTFDAMNPPKVQAARVFVLVPLVTWIVSGIASLLRIARR